MKVSKIHSSLKDLNKDIGNCEKHLSRVLNIRDNREESARSRSIAKNSNDKPGYRQPTAAQLSKCTTRQGQENLKFGKSQTPNKSVANCGRNVICREFIGNNNHPTRVEVVVSTKSSKKRSKSVQPSRMDHENPSRDNCGRTRSFNNRDAPTKSSNWKNSSWGHILQQQSSSACDVQRLKEAHTLQYSSTDEDDQSSAGLEKWVENVSHRNARSNQKSPFHSVHGNMRTSDFGDVNYPSFNPLRTLNFLMKELRGKIHKGCDENMVRIVEDMEKALSCVPQNTSHPTHDSCSGSKLHTSHHHIPNSSLRSRIHNFNHVDSDLNTSKSRINCKLQDQELPVPDSSPNLIDRLLSTVSRITKIAGKGEEKEDSVPASQKDKLFHDKLPLANTPSESLQAQLELGCKQLEATCRQMEETCENLRHQKNQLMSDLKQKTQQIEVLVGKNQQLTVYAADIRQDLLRVKQSAEMVQLENDQMKQRLATEQLEILEANCHLKKRLEELLQENERLNTELQLCQLEKDKLNILLSNKDLEVAKLKKEIVDINILVAEQLANVRSFSGKKYSDKLQSLVPVLEKSHESNCDTNKTVTPTSLFNEDHKSHIGDGEGSRSRPICSSPTSSVASSLYNSWQMMSDITATDHDQNPCEPRFSELKEEEIHDEQNRNPSGNEILKKDQDSGSNLASVVNSQTREYSKTDEPVNFKRQQQSAKDLKNGLRDMFHSLKKQTSEAVNITLPSPPKEFENLQETLGLSQWTELSASESTVLFQSDDDSDTNDVS